MLQLVLGLFDRLQSVLDHETEFLFFLVGFHIDSGPVWNASAEYFFGKRVFDILLHRPAKGARAIGRVIADLNEKLFCLFSELDGQFSALEVFAALAEQEAPLFSGGPDR